MIDGFEQESPRHTCAAVRKFAEGKESLRVSHQKQLYRTVVSTEEVGALLLSGWVDLIVSSRWLRLPASHLTARFDGQRRQLALGCKHDLLPALPLQ